MKTLLLSLATALLLPNAHADEARLTPAEQIEYLWGAHAKVFEINRNCKTHETEYGVFVKFDEVYYYQTDCVTRYADIIQRYLDAASVADASLLTLTEDLRTSPECYEGWTNNLPPRFTRACLDAALNVAGEKIEHAIERITQKVIQAQHKNRRK